MRLKELPHYFGASPTFGGQNHNPPMIHPYLHALGCLTLSLGSAAQSTLFTEDFESAPAFTLNTTDAGSSISTWNTWVVNNSYTGGNGDVICLGFPFPYTIVNTAGQPAAIVPQNGNYLHTASVEGIADGILCCSFGAADGFCITADNTFSRMSSDVSTIGYSDVDLTFWWLCAGSASHYGQVYYSTNSGSSWNLISTPITNYNNQTAWVQQTISDPSFGNQATLRFGFKFVNGIGTGAQDPGFGIDDVSIVAQTGTVNSITTQVSSLQLCDGSGVTVDYAATGTYTPGNVFTAQLSNALGSFAAPVAIGSVVSTTSGSVAGTIPAGTAVGSGYRIRVVSSTPPTTGTDNGSDITINNGPSAGTDTSAEICKASGVYDMDLLLGGSPDPGGVWTNPNNQVVSDQFDSAGQPGGNYTYTVTGQPPCADAIAVLAISLVDPANAGVGSTQLVCSTSSPQALIGFLSSSPDANGYWLNPGSFVTDQLFDPTVDAPGLYTYIVLGQGPCPNDSAFVEVQIVTEPDAGTSATATICANAAPVALVTLLGGTPDAGGSWVGPNSQPHGPQFDASVDPSGLYTYTVDPGAPCVAATASVAVIIDPCTGIEENNNAGLQLQWLGGDAVGLHTLALRGAQCADAQVKLLDPQGRLLLDKELSVARGRTESRIVLDLSGMAAGAFVVVVECNGITTALPVSHTGR